MKQNEDVLSGLLDEASEPGHAEALSELAQALLPGAPSHAARERLLTSARSPALRWAPHFDKLAALFDLGEPQLLEIAESSARSERWENLPLAGVRLFHLIPGPALAGADAGLVSIPAGTSFPLHRHLGEERTLVLEGALREPDGTLYRAGDSLTRRADTSHAFQVLPGATLIYAVVLFAAIEIDGVRFPSERPGAPIRDR